MARAISESGSNPAAMLRDEYSALMRISSMATMRDEAMRIVRTSEISDENLAKFERVVDKITGLDELRMYLTNYILAADGHRVRNPRLSEHEDTRRNMRKYR